MRNLLLLLAGIILIFQYCNCSSVNNEDVAIPLKQTDGSKLYLVRKVLNKLLKSELERRQSRPAPIKRNYPSEDNELTRKTLNNLILRRLKQDLQQQLKEVKEDKDTVRKHHAVIEDKNSHKHEENGLNDHWAEAEHTHHHDELSEGKEEHEETHEHNHTHTHYHDHNHVRKHTEKHNHLAEYFLSWKR